MTSSSSFTQSNCDSGFWDLVVCERKETDRTIEQRDRCTNKEGVINDPIICHLVGYTSLQELKSFLNLIL